MALVKSFFSYLFDTTPGPDFGYKWPMIILSILLIIGATVFNAYYKKRKKSDIAFKKLFKSVSAQMLTFGILILIFTAVRYENIPYFAMRIWFAAMLAVFIYYIYKNLRTWKKDYPKLSEASTQQKAKKATVKTIYTTKKKRKH